jgi:hypothetical protein
VAYLFQTVCVQEVGGVTPAGAGRRLPPSLANTNLNTEVLEMAIGQLLLILLMAGPLRFHVYLPNAAPPAPHVTKKGLSLAYAFCQDMKSTKSSWTYNWGGTPPNCPGVDNVPMAYGSTTAWWPPNEQYGSPWLLGFNEPDLAGQASLTPDAAAQLWRQIETRYRHKLLVSPAPAQTHPEWLTQFREAYKARYGSPPRLDALGAHCYGSIATCEEYIRKVEATATAWGVKGGVWVTEVATSPLSDAAALVAWLEAEPGIARYAWFTNRETSRDSWASGIETLVDSNTGAINAYGHMYADQTSR